MDRSVQLPAPGRGAYDRSLSRADRDAQHRERLLLATAEVLANGPPTIARIVERAGVGRNTFYEFFDSTEHVLEHLERRALRALDVGLESAFAEARTPLERVRAITRSWLVELEARPMEAKLALTQRSGGEPLSPAGKLLNQVLHRVAQAARLDGTAWFSAANDVTLLAAAAAVEAVSRRHLSGKPIHEPAQALAEVVTKLLR
jgi:AcrR family transcriptional regulator